MRYYNIKIDGIDGNIFPARYENGAQWGTITPDGRHDPNAQQVEFQLHEVNATTPTENSVLTIYGVSWQQIQATNQLNGKPITILGGMSPGLPLASFQSHRDKFLMYGMIAKAWGNWIGTDTSIGMSFLPAAISQAQDSGGGGGGGGGGGNGGGGGASAGGSAFTLGRGWGTFRYNRVGVRSIDRLTLPSVPSALVANPLTSIASTVGGQLLSNFDIGPATQQFGNIVGTFFGGGNIAPLSNPINLIHNLLPNMPLSSAVQQTLSTAFPQASLNVQISSLLQLAYQDAGMYQSLEQYAQYINNLSQSMLGSHGYQGVQISTHSNVLDVWDNSIGNGDISYLELVAQPTWIDVNKISVKVVLRGGLHIGMTLTLPQTLVGFSGADAMVPLGGTDQRTNVTLPGDYIITDMWHIGDFRNPDGASWSTNYEALNTNAFTAPVEASQQMDQSNQQQNPTEPVITFRNPNNPTSPPPPGFQSNLIRRSVRKYG